MIDESMEVVNVGWHAKARPFLVNIRKGKQ
jgi:hypothetical protein